MKEKLKSLDHSLIINMLIYPSSFSVLNGYSTHQIFKYNQLKNFQKCLDPFGSLLIKMNPLLLENITEEENEINTIIHEDNLGELKSKIFNQLLDKNHQDRNKISLIEKCVFFNSKKCIQYLIGENILISRHPYKTDNKEYEIGLMEYGVVAGNRDIINFCLEKGQTIQKITLVLGLLGHQNELVEWMIEEGKRRNYFDETIKTQIFGLVDNIEFNEQLIKTGMDINKKDNDQRKKDKEILC